MNQAYVELKLQLHNTDSSLIIAELNEWGFSGFDETEDQLKAYIEYSLAKAHDRVREAERKIAAMERYVTSSRYDLDKEFSKL